MDKEKRKPQRERLSPKDEAGKENQASTAAFSKPISPDVHSGIPQGSVSQTKEVSPQETLEKAMSDMKISEFPVQKDGQQYSGHSSGAKPKTSTQPKRKPKQQQFSANDESKRKNQASAITFSNPASLYPHPNSSQNLASESREVSQQEMLEKQRSDIKITELPIQKNGQQYPGHLQGAKRKTPICGGGMQEDAKVDALKEANQKDDSLHIYTVLSPMEKVGKKGGKIQLRANHFPMKINVPGGVIYHYDVNFIFADKKEVKKSDRKLLLEAIERLKGKNPEKFHHPAVVFDGFKNVYTCEKLDFSSGVFEDNVDIKEHATNLKVPEVKVILKYVSHVNVSSALEKYYRLGTTEAKPDDAIQALNIVLNMSPQLHFEIIGQNYFNPNRENGTAIDIGGGASLWVGTFSSVRLGWKPMLNLDVANRVVLQKSLSVEEFIRYVLKSNREYNSSHISLKKKRHFDAVDEKIRNLKIQYERPNGKKIDYRVIRMMPAANRLKIKQENEKEYTIEQYFKDRYDYQLKFPEYPCIHAGKPEETVYLPIELCMMKKQSLPTTSLTNNQSQKMISQAAKPPKERRGTIEENLRKLSNHYEEDPHAKAFGLKISNEMIRVDGRKLNPPALKYRNVDEFRKFNNGKWRVGRPGDETVLKFLIPTNLKYWGILDLSNLSAEAKKQFVNRLRSEGSLRGMVVDDPIYEDANIRNVSQVKETFTKLFHDLRRKKENQEGEKETRCKPLIMVINPSRSSIKDELKYLGDTTHIVSTQFILKTNATRKDYQVLHNICLKINHKLGGVNYALSKKPPTMNRNVLVMGADVTHPPPHDSSQRPSIAAVVGSTDPDVSQFNVEIRLQERVTKEVEGKPKVRAVEEIKEMENVALGLLSKFHQERQRYPEQIIYYRDGVSEGQFLTVLKHELSAIRRACAEIEKIVPGYKPEVTFIIAQKRHKTRLFVENSRDCIGKNSNVPSGTVVDTEITTLSEIDFFLASHEGIKVITLCCFLFVCFLAQW